MTFGDNGDVGFKMFTERDNWGVYYAMTDDATADNISLQSLSPTPTRRRYTPANSATARACTTSR
ncbi:MAG: hypothetical protein ACLRSE_05905 [Alistipes finegoldii]